MGSLIELTLLYTFCDLNRTAEASCAPPQNSEQAMHSGRTVFSQIMDFAPWILIRFMRSQSASGERRSDEIRVAIGWRSQSFTRGADAAERGVSCAHTAFESSSLGFRETRGEFRSAHGFGCAGNNSGVPKHACCDQFLFMDFAQLAQRESLRDIEACLRTCSPMTLRCLRSP
jgi:Domain of unknown function (DUF4372)